MMIGVMRSQAIAARRSDSFGRRLIHLRMLFIFLTQRLKCGTAEKKRPERSELAALSAVATTGLLNGAASRRRLS